VEEIMVKCFGGTSYDFTVEVLFLEHLVNIGAVAMHTLGEPLHLAPLFIKNRFDYMSYVKIRHQPYVGSNIFNLCKNNLKQRIISYF